MDTVFFDRGEAESRHFTAVEYGRVLRIPPDEWEREASALLARAQSLAPDPTVFDEFKPWFWRMVASTDRIDSYGTKMQPSSLKNYAADYTEGRAFLIGHDKRAIPTGYTLSSRYIAGQGGGVPRTEVDVYALTGLPRVDDAVVSIRGGTLRDASISFSGGKWICSIDGADMLRASWEDCWHFPGAWYRKDDGKKKGKSSEEMVQCIAFVEDARAHEVSGVYDGATPGAGVVKALRAAEAGLLPPEARTVLEVQYRIDLPGDRIYPAAAFPRMEGRMGDLADRAAEGAQETPPATAGEGVTPEAERAATPPATATPPTLTPDALAALMPRVQVEDAVRGLGLDPGTDALAALRTFATDLPKLRAQAQFGEQMRQQVIKEALDYGVRAMGNAFNRDSWQTQLGAHDDYATLVAFRDNFKAMGEVRLPNGRATVDGPAATAQQQPAATPTPDAAFRV